MCPRKFSTSSTPTKHYGEGQRDLTFVVIFAIISLDVHLLAQIVIILLLLLEKLGQLIHLLIGSQHHWHLLAISVLLRETQSWIDSLVHLPRVMRVKVIATAVEVSPRAKVAIQERMLLLRWLSLAHISDEFFKLGDSGMLKLNKLFCVFMDPIIGIELLLQLNNRLISLI